MEQLPRERLTIGLGALSLAESVFEMTRDYVKKRKAFGKTLSKLQVTYSSIWCIFTHSGIAL